MRAGGARTDSEPRDGASPAIYSNRTEKSMQKTPISLHFDRGHTCLRRFTGMFVASDSRRRCFRMRMRLHDDL